MSLMPMAHARPSTCTVSPDPVTLGVDDHFTVTATGGTPLEYYEVTDQQAGHHKTDEARVWLGQADEFGTVTAVIGVADGRITGDGIPEALWPGDVSVKVVRYRTGGGPGGAASTLATCSFTVVDTPTIVTPNQVSTRRIAVLLINFSNDPRQPWTPSFIDSLYDGPIGTVASQADAAATAAGVGLSLYTNKAYVWPQNDTVGACRSTGEMPGTRTWVALQTTCTPTACAARSALWHEFGHNLGLNHAAAYNCNGVVYSNTCTSSEYGDSFDIMGCCSNPLISNLGRLKLGWIPPAQVVTVTQNSTITVTRVNDPTSLVYRFSLGDGNFIYIENRAERTIYENGPGTWTGGMLLFRVAPDYTVTLANPPGAFPFSYLLDGSPESNTNPQTRGLPVGASFTTPDGVTITNQAFDGTNNTVQIGL